MSALTPWDECLARPTEGERIFYLSDHLEGVRKNARSLFTKNKNQVLQFMLELAAVSHDIGKGHHDWQCYIRGKSSRGPNHAECGAVFFAYLAYYYLNYRELWGDYQNLWLLITRDIADHHVALKGFVHNGDLDTDSFAKMDMEGIENWLFAQFPELKESGVKITTDSIDDWLYEYPEIVENAIFDFYSQEREAGRGIDDAMDCLQQWRDLTTLLIAADRFDIEPVEDQCFHPSDWSEMNKSIQQFCLKGGHHPLARIRSQAQESIMDQWEENKNASYYVLEMPTGYGKTVTALKLAAAIANERKLSKIIYVAPYLSILEQNTNAIEKATGFKPLQHHSMAVLKKEEKKNRRKRPDESGEQLLDEDELSDELSDLYVQSWADKIVCTSFVQWMKAVFPRTAQETLRRIFLRDAVVIIDEPQIVDETVWNLFLKGASSLSRLHNLTIIFCSATMPPFTYGINTEPIRLSVSSTGENNRYQIRLIQPTDAEQCAMKLAEIDEPSSAAIVNTIYDACDLFDKLPQCSHTEDYLLHGLMIPLHKRLQLLKIEQALKNQREGKSSKRVRVVSTQIIEAGADLSFHYMFRALPILPSLTQAAGRVNRHGEKEMGIIESGMFMRNEMDTRFIYPLHLRKLSDELLFQKEVWLEEEMGALVNLFYQRMFAENSYEAVLEDVTKALDGNWERLSRHEVFDNKEYFRLPLFVPFDFQSYEAFLTDDFYSLLHEFHITAALDIYELFKDKRRKQTWSFSKRKRFSLLFNQFVVQVPVQKALKLASQDDFLRYKVPIIEDGRYDVVLGLIFNEDDIENSFI